MRTAFIFKWRQVPMCLHGFQLWGICIFMSALKETGQGLLMVLYGWASGVILLTVCRGLYLYCWAIKWRTWIYVPQNKHVHWNIWRIHIVLCDASAPIYSMIYSILNRLQIVYYCIQWLYLFRKGETFCPCTSKTSCNHRARDSWKVIHDCLMKNQTALGMILCVLIGAPSLTASPQMKQTHQEKF